MMIIVTHSVEYTNQTIYLHKRHSQKIIWCNKIKRQRGKNCLSPRNETIIVMLSADVEHLSIWTWLFRALGLFNFICWQHCRYNSKNVSYHLSFGPSPTTQHTDGRGRYMKHELENINGYYCGAKRPQRTTTYARACIVEWCSVDAARPPPSNFFFKMRFSSATQVWKVLLHIP